MPQTNSAYKSNNVNLSYKSNIKSAIIVNGQATYLAPIEIKNSDDIRCLGISWDDCKTLHFGKNYSITVYYLPTTNKKFVDFLWAELNSRHSKEYRNTRCQIRGKFNKLKMCPDTISCSNCPYHRKPEDRQPSRLSWDELITSGSEPECDNDYFKAFLDQNELASIKKEMDSKDPNIARVMELKEIHDLDVHTIAEILKITERQVYYCIDQAKSIGASFKKNHY